MEAFARGSAVQIRDLDQPQEFGIFYESAKVELKASEIGLIFV